MTMTANGAWYMRIINSTKPLNITDGTAGKQTTGGTNWPKRARVAGANAIAGGMKMGTAGTPIATGMITITIATKTPRS